MAISEAYSSTGLTVSTTELSLVSGTSTLQTVTTDGIFQCLLDLNALALGDSFDFRIYEKVAGGSTKRIAFIATFANAQGADNAVWISPSLVLLHGWDMTLIRTAGADRSIGYSIRSVA
jgi:hypothetical protein